MVPRDGQTRNGMRELRWDCRNVDGRKKQVQVMPCHPSQFLNELPPELIEHGDEKGKRPVTTESGNGMFAAMREMLD